LIRFAETLAFDGLRISPFATFIGWQIIFPFNFSAAMLFAMAYVAFLATIIGYVCGLICGVVTLLFFRKIQSDPMHTVVMMTVSGVSAFAITLIVVGMSSSVFAVVETPVVSEVSLLAGSLAAIGAGYAGYHAGKEHLEQQKPV
jgi:hypothetical protein